MGAADVGAQKAARPGMASEKAVSMPSSTTTAIVLSRPKREISRKRLLDSSLAWRARLEAAAGETGENGWLSFKAAAVKDS